MPPRELAAKMAEALRNEDTSLASVEVAGPGFLNVTFSPEFWRETIRRIDDAARSLWAGHCWERLQGTGGVRFGQPHRPSPYRSWPGRGGGRYPWRASSVLPVMTSRRNTISTTLAVRCGSLAFPFGCVPRNLPGIAVEWPEDYYRGSYIIDIAREMMDKDPGLTSLSDAEGQDRCFAYGMQTILDGIKEDLREFRVEHQVWFSERSLVERGAVEETFERLKKAGLSFEKDGALWFRTTDFGDDKDRVLRKSDGSLTYFASDIAYHDDKYRRGFDRVVDVWGADHHGYVPRMKAAVQAVGRKAEDLDVVLIQLVNLLENGTQVAMSTRAGQFETLADVVKEVGVDAARFMFLSRKSDSHLDFDLALVKQRSMDNPVYYVQYAHARVRSVLRKAAEAGLTLPEKTDLALLAPLSEAEDLALLHFLDRFEDVAKGAAQALAPHHISYYLMELAGMLHSYYAKHPVLQAGDPELALARLALLRSVGQVVKNGLELLGVSAPESM